MTDPVAAKAAVINSNNINEKEEKPQTLSEVRATRAKTLHDKASNRSLGITSLKINNPEKEENVQNKEPTSEAPKETFLTFEADHDNEEGANALLPTAETKQPSKALKIMYNAGAFLSTIWVGYAVIYSIANGGLPSNPTDLGLLIGGILTPVALLWMIVTNMHRRSEVHYYTSELRKEIHGLLFPSEETAQLINKDVERLCRQAVEVSASSKAVLKSLQRARQGLRAEIRDFSGVSKKAEFHIERLTESLTERGAKLLELTNEIEQRTANIDASTQAGAEAWDQATVHVLQRASEMEAVMGRGSDKLITAAENAQEKTKDIEDILEKNYDRLKDAVSYASECLRDSSSHLDTRSIEITEAADRMREESSRLAESIRNEVEGLENVSEKTTQSLSQSRDIIDAHKTALSETANLVSLQTQNISDAVDTSVNRLSDTVRAIASKTQALETTMDEKSSSLSGLISQIEVQGTSLEKSSEIASEKMKEALAETNEGAEAIKDAIREIMETLDSSANTATDHAKNLTQATAQEISKLQTESVANAEHMNGMVDRLNNSREQLENITANAQENVKELTEAIGQQEVKLTAATANLEERVENVRHALNAPLRDIQSAVKDADLKYEQIENILGRRVDDLNTASDKATQSAETIREVLRGQAQEMSTLSGQIAGNARTINEQMAQQKDTISVQITDTLKDLQRLATDLKNRNVEIAEISEAATTHIGNVSSALDMSCRELTDLTTDTFKQLDSIDETFGTKLTTLNDNAENATETIVKVQRALHDVVADIAPICETNLFKIENVTKQLADLRNNYDQTSQSNLEKLKTIGIAFDERLSSLKTGSEEAATILKSSSENLRERTFDIENSANEASQRMEKATASLRDQTSDMHLVSDQAVLKLEKVGDMINEHFHELSTSVGHAVAQIEQVGSAFEGQSNSIREQANQTAKRYEDLSIKAIEETGMLHEAAQKTAIDTEEMVARVQQEADKMLRNARDTIDQLKSAGNTLTVSAHDFGREMAETLNISEKYAKELKRQNLEIAETSAHTSDAIGKSAAAIKFRMHEMRDVANEVNVKLGETETGISNESERFLRISTAALDATHEAAHMLGKQSEALLKASKDAQTQAETLKDIQNRKQRDAFMNETKFIVESLHSMSVDLSRLAEGEIKEKTWKAYQNGDISAFTERLSALSELLPVGKLRDKFASDHEFRTYTQRFIRQFEELYNQAFENDHGGILTTTIATSSLAKLYENLCKIATKEPCMNTEKLRAA